MFNNWIKLNVFKCIKYYNNEPLVRKRFYFRFSPNLYLNGNECNYGGSYSLLATVIKLLSIKAAD